MRTAILSTLTVLALLFVAAPAAHAEPAATPACQPAAVTAQSLTATLFSPVLEPPEVARKDQGIDGPSAQATCDAQCHDGSTIWCWGSSCSAQDSNCSQGIRGSCWGTDTGTRYCPVCQTGPVCSASASCANAGGGSVSCESFGADDCFAIDDCYAFCDGTYHWCPSPPNPCPI